jgi:hypothetical protein
VAALEFVAVDSVGAGDGGGGGGHCGGGFVKLFFLGGEVFYS